MQAILLVTAPFFAIVLCGYLAARRHVLPESAIPGLNAYVLYFALPPAVSMRACEALSTFPLPANLSLAIEKPFGTDAASAHAFNELLARLVPEGEVVAADLSRGMVETAWRNARQAGLSNMAFVQADVGDPPALFERWQADFEAFAATLDDHGDGIASLARDLRCVLGIALNRTRLELKLFFYFNERGHKTGA